MTAEAYDPRIFIDNPISNNGSAPFSMIQLASTPPSPEFTVSGYCLVEIGATVFHYSPGKIGREIEDLR